MLTFISRVPPPTSNPKVTSEEYTPLSIVRRNFVEFCTRSGADHGEVLLVNSIVGNGAWLGGGAIRRTLIKMKLDSDYDYFFKSQEHFEEWEKKLPVTLKKTRETQHHSQYEGHLGDKLETPVIIQAIKFKFYKTAEEVLDSFDYTITQFVLDGNTLVTTTESLWDLGRRKLALHRVTYPVATMRRMIKYTKQGFTACGGCMQDLFTKTMDNPEALLQMDITYVD